MDEVEIRVPDPHPGRCLNTRYDEASHSMLRCLDYEGVQHVCTFPAPPPPVSSLWGSGGSYVLHTPKPPKPWVKPDV